MGKKCVVRLSEQEREKLQTLVKKGTVKAYRVKHANILLKADANGPGWTDQRIAEALWVPLQVMALSSISATFSAQYFTSP
jgi:hypothetical protein